VAYAFYATDNTYAVAAMVCTTLLRKAGASADFVLLHLPLSRFAMRRLRQMSIRTQLVASRDRSPSWYYRDCLVKLQILHLTDYARVIYLDVDSVPLKSLDDFLTMPLGVPLAAPVAYWLPNPCWSSYLLVVAPSEESWKRVRRRLERTPADRRYDMDVINAEFDSEIESLPPKLTLLNSEWEDRRRPFAFEDPAEAFRNVSLIHMTALGKPWSYTPQRVRRLRPNAHPEFYRMWELWWQTRAEVLQGGGIFLTAADRLSRTARSISHARALWSTPADLRSKLRETVRALKGPSPIR
jgi:glycogenin glucosyltransferase